MYILKGIHPSIALNSLFSTYMLLHIFLYIEEACGVHCGLTCSNILGQNWLETLLVRWGCCRTNLVNADWKQQTKWTML